MIECVFRTEAGSCQHIDDGVGGLVVLHESVCVYCTSNFKERDRKDSYPVQNRIHGERKKRGLSVGKAPVLVVKPKMQTEKREHPKRPNVADELLAAARSVPRMTPAPIVEDPQARLEICEDCPKWIGGRCKASCGSCSNRPRPLSEKGKDCPLFLWRRR